MRAENVIAISVIAPVSNERENLAPLHEALARVLGATGREYEIVLVNDGSSDGSADVLDGLAARDPRTRIVHLRRRFGQTAALMAGIDHSRGDVVISLDADLQNDPADIPALLEKLDEGYDVCCGWRRARQDPWLTRVLPSRVANWLIARVSGVSLNDFGCTLKACRRELLAETPLHGEMHRFIPIFASWRGARICEIPVAHHPRRYGKSKYGLERTVKVILDLIVIKFLASYAEKPIYVFGGLGLLSFAGALAAFGLMIYFKFWGGKSFIETPLPSVVTLFFLTGLMAMLGGLIAELVVRTSFEAQGKRSYVVASTRNFES